MQNHVPRWHQAAHTAERRDRFWDLMKDDDNVAKAQEKRKEY